MQLRVARLCLDCEELHDAQQCPVCASESFAYLTRWIPVDDRRRERRTTRTRPAQSTPSNRSGWVARSALGAAAVALIAAGEWARRSLMNSRDAEFRE